jgi:hypothetical protein
MKNLKRSSTILVCISVWLVPAVTFCGHDGLGGLSLAPQPSARAIAMGETDLLDVGTVDGFACNPASIPSVPATEVALGYGNRVQGLSASTAVISAVVLMGTMVELPVIGTVGRRYGIGVCLEHDGVELSQGSDWSSEMVCVGLGYRLAPYASVGLATKLLLSRTGLQGAGAKGFGIDLGAILDVNSVVSLALAVRNSAGTVSWDEGQSESPPFIGAFGGRLSLPYGVTGNACFSVSNADRSKVGLGIEVPIARTGLDLRAGYLRHGDDNSRGIMTAGFGIAYSRFSLDYAVRMDDEIALGTTHILSVGAAVGRSD